MTFQLDCPFCGKPVTAPAELVGRMAACPYCSKHFSIPKQGARPVPVISPNTFIDFRAIRFTFSCQRCSSILEATSPSCGHPGRCPTCGAVFIVPAVDRNTGLPTGPAVVADDGQLPTPVHAYAAAGDKAPKIRRLADERLVIVCPRCEAHMSVDANICSACGIPFTIEGAAIVTKADPNRNGLASAALVLGVASAFLFKLVIFGPLAIGLGIGGLWRAKKQGKPYPGRATAWIAILCGGASLAILLAWQLLP